MKPAFLVAALLGASAASAAEAPAPADFAHGLTVSVGSRAPVQQFTVPEAVYQGVTRADLGDLRLFNAGGMVVPHALCTAPVPTAPSLRELGLLVYPLRIARPGNAVAQGGRVTVQTPGGTSVQVVEGGASPALTPVVPQATPADSFVVDATAAPGALRTLRLGWSTPDGASEAHVRVEASEDLNVWRTVVAGATLLHVTADGRALERNQIELPEARYRYLRLVRSSGPAVVIRALTADVVVPASAAPPAWFAAMPAADAGGEGYVFDSGRLAPVHAARIELPQQNMAIRAALESRRAPDAPWQARWTGEVTSAADAGGAAFGIAGIPDGTFEFAPVADTLWRVRIVRGSESIGDARPVLRLGYHPARLRFLAQGEPPYTLAFGSARVAPAERLPCDGLMPAGGQDLIGLAQTAPAPAGAFGGAEVLTPAPKPTPLRQILLWAALLLGAAAVVGMALVLLRRLREGDAGS